MRKYGESKTTRIMMATVPHVTSGSGPRKFQADGFLFDRVYVFITNAVRLIVFRETVCVLLCLWESHETVSITATPRVR